MTGERLLNYFDSRTFADIYDWPKLVLHHVQSHDLRREDRYRFLSDFFSLDIDDKGTPLLSVDKPEDVIDLVGSLG